MVSFVSPSLASSLYSTIKEILRYGLCLCFVVFCCCLVLIHLPIYCTVVIMKWFQCHWRTIKEDQYVSCINRLRPKQNGCHFSDSIFKCIFLNKKVSVSLKISLKFVPKGSINYILALVQIIAWCHSCNKPLCETMMVSILTHICFTRPQ